MGSYFASPIFRIVIIVSLSLIFKALVRGRLRNRITPICIAYLFFHICALPLTIGASHFLMMVAYFLSMSFLLDWGSIPTVRKNRPMLIWLIFWGYLTISSFWCEAPLLGVFWFINCHIELFLVGYFAGGWMLRVENGWRKCLVPFLISSSLIVILYMRNGFGVEVDMTGRGGFGEGTFEEGTGFNVNDVGLAIGAVLSFASCIIVENLNLKNIKRKDSLLLISQVIVATTLLVFLVKTGSRNSATMIIPLLYYLFTAGSNHSRSWKIKKAIMPCVLIAIASCVVWITMKGVYSIRAFTINLDGGSFDWNVATTGRMGEYEWFLSDMSGIDWLVGKGPKINRIPGEPLMVGGCLSVYVTLLRNGGVFGMVLLFIAFLSLISAGSKGGSRGKIAILLFGAWALTGLGEGANIRRGGGYRFLQGAAFAMCSKALLDTRQQRRYDYLQWGYYPQPMMGRSI